LVIEVDVDVLMPLLAGKSGRCQAVRQPPGCRHPDAPVVQPGAASALGGKQFAAHRIENHARDHFTGALEAERDVEHRKTVREVGGAIERCDVPAELGRSLVSAAFFGHDAVRRKVRSQALHYEALTGAISLRHQVEIALELESYAPLEIGGKQRAGF